VSFLAHALVIMLLGAVGALLVAVVALFLARRFVRRRWKGVRTHIARRGFVASVSVLAAWREWAVSRRTPEELTQGTAARARRNMWVAIEDAEAAVRHADAVDAPVAELPSVCRSLRAVGGELDSLLRLERRIPAARGRPDAVRAQAAQVITAARDVQLAALRTCSDAHDTQLRALVRDARDEVEIVADALSHLRSVGSQGR